MPLRLECLSLRLEPRELESLGPQRPRGLLRRSSRASSRLIRRSRRSPAIARSRHGATRRAGRDREPAGTPSQRAQSGQLDVQPCRRPDEASRGRAGHDRAQPLQLVAQALDRHRLVQRVEARASSDRLRRLARTSVSQSLGPDGHVAVSGMPATRRRHFAWRRQLQLGQPAHAARGGLIRRVRRARLRRAAGAGAIPSRWHRADPTSSQASGLAELRTTAVARSHHCDACAVTSSNPRLRCRFWPPCSHCASFNGILLGRLALGFQRRARPAAARKPAVLWIVSRPMA